LDQGRPGLATGSHREMAHDLSKKNLQAVFGKDLTYFWLRTIKLVIKVFEFTSRFPAQD
jgi:hypothetical protein